MPAQIIFDFKKSVDVQHWKVVDDVVMGGESSGTFKVKNNVGAFEGNISLDNNGGFSSLRYDFEKVLIGDYTKVIITLKGDRKDYQFRIKSNSGDYSYVASFSTSGEWEEVEIPLKMMYPSFRGRKLDQANFSDDHLKEITFLIGNKKEESFILLLEKLELQ